MSAVRRRTLPPSARPPYARELQELPATYASARTADVGPLREQMLALAAGPARMIGTGGTTAVAQLAAQLHEHLSAQPAQAVTPLQFLQGPRLARCGALLFSARARHPDARMVLERLQQGEYAPAGLVTHRDPSEIAGPLGDVAVIQVPAPELAEGFLATNSVLATVVALLRAALGDDALPADLLEAPLAQGEPGWRDRLLVVYPPNLAPVAIDLETRCSELGLAPVQLADLRNVAHGRHTGLARTAESTTVLVLSDRDSAPLAQVATEPLAASGAELAMWHADQPWPASIVPLLQESMRLTGHLASRQGVDPAKPRVPAFGRCLYHLPLRRLLARPAATPVERKLAALGGGEAVPRALPGRYAQAFEAWRKEVAATPIGGVVLDYDGTVCATAERYDLPRPDVQDALRTVLEAGLRLGFASGRGRSLHQDLRRWVPERHWPGVALGLYNGAVPLTLADDVPPTDRLVPLMADVARRLADAPFAGLLQVVGRSGQVSVQVAEDGFFHAGRLADLVRDLLAQAPALPVKVVASAHSVDVVAQDTSKVRVLQDVAAAAAGAVLAIGDQGDLGGNDHELLAATPLSISVARCSADPTRCWYVDPAGRRGPAALVAVLDALRYRGDTATLDVRAIARRMRRA